MPLAAPLLVAAALSCAQPSSPALVGLWESKTTSQGGIGHVFEFRRDGSFVESSTVLVNLPASPETVEEHVRQSRAAGIPGDLREGVKYRHSTGAMAFERITADGEILFRLPMRSARGCYAFSSSSLTLDPFRGRKTTLGLAVKGRTAELRVEGNPQSLAYGRSPYGAWYDIEHIDYVAPASPPR